MMRAIVANVFAIGGLGSLVGAGWIVHPGLGLAVLGVASLAVAVGMVKFEALVRRFDR